MQNKLRYQFTIKKFKIHNKYFNNKLKNLKQKNF